MCSFVTCHPPVTSCDCGYCNHVMPRHPQSCPGRCLHNPFKQHTGTGFFIQILYTTVVMGLTDSKMTAEIVSEACSKAEKSGEHDIKAVLTDPKVSFSSNSRSGAKLNFTRSLNCFETFGLTSLIRRREKLVMVQKIIALKKFENSESPPIPNSFPLQTSWGRYRLGQKIRCHFSMKTKAGLT